MADNTNQPQPSLIGGHAQYVKGVAEVSPNTKSQCSHRVAIQTVLTATSQSTIGDVSGSHAWKSSGEQDKAAAMDTMKAAGEQRDESQGYGKVEEVAGKVTGCEGMQKEGAASKQE